MLMLQIPMMNTNGHVLEPTQEQQLHVRRIESMQESVQLLRAHTQHNQQQIPQMVVANHYQHIQILQIQRQEQPHGIGLVQGLIPVRMPHVPQPQHTPGKRATMNGA